MRRDTTDKLKLSTSITIVASIVFLVTACSFKSVYNQLDFLIAEYVEGLVTLDDARVADLVTRTELLLDWHRTTQLKQYADWFRELQNDVNTDPDDARLQYHVKKLETYWNSISYRLHTEMAEFLPRLSKEQVTELFESMHDKNEEFREDYIEIDNSERLENYVENITDTFEDWFDELSAEQLHIIEQAASRLKSSAIRRLDLRKQWQLTIQEILETDHTQVEKQQLLTAYFKQDDINNDPELREINQANIKVLRELTVNIVHTLTKQQKAYFKQRTDDYIRMFEELAEYR